MIYVYLPGPKITAPKITGNMGSPDGYNIFYIPFGLFICFLHFLAAGQQAKIDSLFTTLKTEEDRNRTSSLTELGNLYFKSAQENENKCNYPKSIDDYLESLKIREELNDREGIANSCRGIGNVYRVLQEYKRAFEYYSKCLNNYTLINNKKGIAASIGNIGVLYSELPDSACIAFGFPSSQKQIRAIENFTKCLKIYEELGDTLGMEITYNNIANRYFEFTDTACILFNISPADKYNLALEYYLKSLKLAEEIIDTLGIGYAYSNIGGVYLQQKKYPLALKNLKIGLGFIEQMGDINTEKEIRQHLYQTHKQMGNTSEALIHYEKYVSLKDSTFSIENQREIIRKQTRYEYDKREAVAKTEAEKEQQKQRIIIYAKHFIVQDRDRILEVTEKKL